MPTSGIPPPVATPLGTPIPALLPHAISVSLPKWKDNVDYEEGKSRVMDKLQNGYPRFFIHRSIQKVSGSDSNLWPDIRGPGQVVG